MNEKLRPCPWCGSKNLRKHTEDIECENCKCNWPEYWWNTRPTEDALVKALEECKEALEEYNANDTSRIANDAIIAASAALALAKGEKP